MVIKKNVIPAYRLDRVSNRTTPAAMPPIMRDMTMIIVLSLFDVHGNMAERLPIKRFGWRNFHVV